MLRPRHFATGFALALSLACGPFAVAQTGSQSNTPAAIPAGAAATSPSNVEIPKPAPVSEKQTREADDFYLQGAKEINRQDYVAAERSFARAAQLNPSNTDYTLALVYAREGRVTQLTRKAAIARKAGDATAAAAMLAEAHGLDPDNRIAAQHLSAGGEAFSPTFDPLLFPAADIASTLDAAPELQPVPGNHSFHERGDAQSVLIAVYRAFGIAVQFDPSVGSSAPIRFDLDDVSYATATTLIHTITRTFAVAVQPTVALIAKDTTSNRDRLVPLMEETLYIPGETAEQMTELATLARNVFDVKNITASATSGTLLIRADSPTLKILNAQYADMLEGQSDVQLDVTLYEIDEATVRNFGITFPSSIGGFDIASELNNALTANAAAITAAVNNNILVLSGSEFQQTLEKIAFLKLAGLLSATQLSELTGLLATVGTFGGAPFIGVTLASGSTVNALYTSSDARILDDLKLRVGNNQASSFRAGSRYPIITSTYSSGGTSSALTSALSGLTASQQALASSLLGSGSAQTIPQVQFEDLGLTLKATPQIQRSDSVSLKLDLKIEALGAGSLNGIPVLNSRQFTSTVTVPIGQTALLLSNVNRNELGSVSGTPGLNDLPGFTGTDKSTNNATGEILIAITPHVLREQTMRLASRRLLYPHTSSSASE